MLTNTTYNQDKIKEDLFEQLNEFMILDRLLGKPKFRVFKNDKDESSFWETIRFIDKEKRFKIKYLFKGDNARLRIVPNRFDEYIYNALMKNTSHKEFEEIDIKIDPNKIFDLSIHITPESEVKQEKEGYCGCSLNYCHEEEKEHFKWVIIFELDGEEIKL
ncbi:MAG: hypothetical protein GY830_10185 [Bacteroidetes bacterium]|nr:hypothetical protein [Bacteroidota bacterium]